MVYALVSPSSPPAASSPAGGFAVVPWSPCPTLPLRIASGWVVASRCSLWLPPLVIRLDRCREGARIRRGYRWRPSMFIPPTAVVQSCLLRSLFLLVITIPFLYHRHFALVCRGVSSVIPFFGPCRSSRSIVRGAALVPLKGGARIT